MGESEYDALVGYLQKFADTLDTKSEDLVLVERVIGLVLDAQERNHG